MVYFCLWSECHWKLNMLFRDVITKSSLQLGLHSSILPLFYHMLYRFFPLIFRTCLAAPLWSHCQLASLAQASDLPIWLQSNITAKPRRELDVEVSPIYRRTRATYDLSSLWFHWRVFVGGLRLPTSCACQPSRVYQQTGKNNPKRTPLWSHLVRFDFWQQLLILTPRARCCHSRHFSQCLLYNVTYGPIW